MSEDQSEPFDAAEPTDGLEPTDGAESADLDPAGSLAHVAEQADVTEAAEPMDATGHPAVDEVLRSLEGLDPQDPDAHVPVFERAHESLRQSLQDAQRDDASQG